MTAPGNWNALQCRQMSRFTNSDAELPEEFEDTSSNAVERARKNDEVW
jgi:hypothetical protein